MQSSRKARSLPTKIHEVPAAATFLLKHSPSSDVVESGEVTAENIDQPEEATRAAISKIEGNSGAIRHNVGVVTTEFSNAVEVATKSAELGHFHYRFIFPTKNYLQELSATYAPIIQTMQDSMTRTRGNDRECRYTLY